jgi:hypothetical protein
VLFINKRNFCVPCFIWFLLPFKILELFLLHPVFVSSLEGVGRHLVCRVKQGVCLNPQTTYIIYPLYLPCLSHCICLFIHLCVCVRVCACACMCVHMCICVCVHARVCSACGCVQGMHCCASVFISLLTVTKSTSTNKFLHVHVNSVHMNLS